MIIFSNFLYIGRTQCISLSDPYIWIMCNNCGFSINWKSSFRIVHYWTIIICKIQCVSSFICILVEVMFFSYILQIQTTRRSKKIFFQTWFHIVKVNRYIIITIRTWLLMPESKSYTIIKHVMNSKNKIISILFTMHKFMHNSCFAINTIGFHL